MTEPDRSQATSDAAADARDNRAHHLLLTLGITGVLGVLLLGAALLWQNGHITQLRDAGNTTASQAQQLAQQVRSLGGTPIVTPATPGPTGPTGAQGPGPTQAQIDAAVSAQLAAHPPAAGQNATPAMVATAVAVFLVAHPPQPGRPPTAEEIASAAGSYIASHTADFRGPGGTNGTNGKDATDAQVAATVSAFCAAHGQCAGPPGTNGTNGTNGADGAQGVSITDLVFARDSNGQCQAVVTLHDPASGTNTQVTHTAGDAACPLSLGTAPLIHRN